MTHVTNMNKQIKACSGFRCTWPRGSDSIVGFLYFSSLHYETSFVHVPTVLGWVPRKKVLEWRVAWIFIGERSWKSHLWGSEEDKVEQRKTLTSKVVEAEASANPTGSSGSFQSCPRVEAKSLCLYQQIVCYVLLSGRGHNFDEEFPCGREQIQPCGIASTFDNGGN